MLFISTLFGLPIDYSYMQKAPLNLQSDFDPNKYLTVWYDSRWHQSVSNICVIIWLKQLAIFRARDIWQILKKKVCFLAPL